MNISADILPLWRCVKTKKYADLALSRQNNVQIQKQNLNKGRYCWKSTMIFSLKTRSVSKYVFVRACVQWMCEFVCVLSLPANPFWPFSRWWTTESVVIDHVSDHEIVWYLSWAIFVFLSKVVRVEVVQVSRNLKRDLQSYQPCWS